ncbi:Uncharacterized protein Rs2_33220 [Raphanus sativus]|nr:Uncharacterized protein Rs2_33220 [Raphanus sativus]
MSLDIAMDSGEIKQVELEYEGLEKHCFLCFSLSHERESCPSVRASANSRDGSTRMGISQTRTLDKLEADRRRNAARKESRAESNFSSGQRFETSNYPTREFNWKHDKDFRYNYGARRDPNYKEYSSRQDPIEVAKRPSARERLSFHRDSTTSSQRESQARTRFQTPRTEWRPLVSNSQTGNSSKAVQPQSSHTPSPRPQREGGSSLVKGSHDGRLRSGDSNPLSQDRRSALDRLSLPTERIPLLQDGVANSASGRLQEVDIQYLEDTTPRIQSGGSNVPSSSKTPIQDRVLDYDATQDRSPIRSLSEDRLHVSMRLGPLIIHEEDDTVPTRSRGKNLRSTVALGSQKGKAPETSTTRKRVIRSPAQGVSVKKRRTTKAQSSPRVRPVPASERKNKAAGT